MKTRAHRCAKRCAAIAVIAWLMTTGLKAGPLDDWAWRNPVPTGDGLSDVTFGRGLYVVVGPSGAIVTSVDGIMWQQQKSGINDFLHGVTYAGGLFVAVGNTILTSPDGTNWIQRINSVPSSLLDAGYGNGMFVSVGGNGAILTSSNGENWIQRRIGSPPGTFKFLNEVAYGNGLFVAVGTDDSSGLSLGQILTSTDGIVWTERESGSLGADPVFWWQGITYGGGLFVAGGSFYERESGFVRGVLVSSADGIQWSNPIAVTNTDSLSGIDYDDGLFIAVGAGVVLTSTDAENWTTRIPTDPYYPLLGIGHGDAGFVAVGGGVDGAPVCLLTSTDGMEWTPRHGLTFGNLNGLVYGNGMFVAVGSEPGGVVHEGRTNIVLSSPTGTNWTIRYPGGEGNAGGTLNSVTFGSGQFVAVGGRVDFEFGPVQSTILTSMDGVSWIDQSPPTNISLTGVTRGNGLFVAVGAQPGDSPDQLFGKVLSSPDGSTWTVHDVETGNPWISLKAVTWGKGMFVAIGSESVFTSIDGIHWTNEVRLPVHFLYDVTFGNNRFVAVGQYGVWIGYPRIFMSDDGMQWTLVGEFPANTITYGNGLFLALGGAVMTSPDGLNWTQRSAKVGGSRSTFGDNTFVAVGREGTILQSGKIGPRIQPMSAFIGDRLEFDVFGAVGRSYQIECSKNLRDWTFVTTLTATNSDGTVRFVESERMDSQRLFYRAVSR